MAERYVYASLPEWAREGTESLVADAVWWRFRLIRDQLDAQAPGGPGVARIHWDYALTLMALLDAADALDTGGPVELVSGRSLVQTVEAMRQRLTEAGWLPAPETTPTAAEVSS